MATPADESPTLTPSAAPPGQVSVPSIDGLPSGYSYAVTRYADVILQGAFNERLQELIYSLTAFHPTLDELRSGGGGRTVFVRRFDDSLASQYDREPVWGKRNITIEKAVGFDDARTPFTRVRGHEIDMFGIGSPTEPFPGVAVEMEWNNKDPFYDRDLINFQALHREGAISVGVIVTRGPRLQELIGHVIRSKDGGLKYGQSTTHWNKLLPRVNLGGGGECPLLLIGIEPERIDGIELAHTAKQKLAEATDLRDNWRKHYSTYREAQVGIKQVREEAERLLPPLNESVDDD